MRFAAREGKWFWSNGEAWGKCELRRRGNGMQVIVKALHGSLALRQLEVAGVGAVALEATVKVEEGESVSWRL
jgi:hypothetical protein